MSEINPDLQEVILLYREQLIGFTEARNLIENVIPAFVEARDIDLDRSMAEEERAVNELAEARGDGQKVGDPEDDE